MEKSSKELGGGRRTERLKKISTGKPKNLKEISNSPESLKGSTSNLSERGGVNRTPKSCIDRNHQKKVIYEKINDAEASKIGETQLLSVPNEERQQGENSGGETASGCSES